ncbi:DEAD/DEAH box helicase [Streptomyces sp. NRRL F-5193]|uniref:DEAD/DEAH box helicase n=1 Tax=Streptomyces sp. NRRL F-5193 TaxID=1463860 RepID=UPI0007C6C305|nr:DEAD/DEAH box helicase [Streptomyces sp. NRRL F-5193]
MTSSPGSSRPSAAPAAVFLPADPPRTGRIYLWSPEDEPLPSPGPAGAAPDELIVVDAADLRTVSVPALSLSVRDALPFLARARLAGDADPATAFWGGAALLGLDLAARGLLLPGVTAGGHDAWRAGPLGPEELDRLRTLAASMPPTAHAVPLDPARGDEEAEDPLLPEPETLLRAFLDAVADTLPRTPAAALAAGGQAFAAEEPQAVPEQRAWAADLAAGHDAGVRLSLRLELAGAGASAAEAPAFRAVLQLHSAADPALVVDAADAWSGAGPAAAALGPRARMDALLALRRAARAWPPLAPLLTAAVPDAMEPADEEIVELLGPASRALAATGMRVHWPRELADRFTTRAVIGPVEEPGAEAEHKPVEEPGAAGSVPAGSGGGVPSFLSADALLAFNWRFSVGDQELTRAELDRLAEAGRPLVRLRDRWVLIDPAEVLRARERQDRKVTPVDALAAVLTVIALHLHRQDEPATAGPTLVVCPTSLMGNWQREFERFAPGTRVRRFHGTARDLDGLANGDVVLTTYGTMRLDAERLAARPWGLLVADEAQHVKNPYSATARRLRTIGARARVALSGTPVENNLSELWAILDWTTPGLLGGLGAFRRRYAAAVEEGTDPAAAERLGALVRPFLLRRRKADPGIAPELPPKTETDRAVSLTPEQAGLYEAVVRENLLAIGEAEGMARRGLVVKLLTSLKQICNHPAQYLKEERPRIAGRSGKLELLDELLDTILAEGASTLVFTQYVGMARLLEAHLAERGVATQFLHGGTPVAAREAMVARFQAGEVPVFLLSLKAAGTGLNLTRAEHVVHYDRWWNPAVEAQATDRAYRIGQTRPVQVHRIIAEGTVEDRIAALLDRKRELADAVLGGSGDTPAELTELTDADLAELVRLRGDDDRHGNGDGR